MVLALTLSLLAAVPSQAAVTTVRGDDPPVKVWLNQDNHFQRGDRARVNVRLAEDGYLVVLRGDAEGRVRVLFPLDPGEDTFVRGGNTTEIRGRGDREAFTIDEREGTGKVLAARSVAPFRFEEYVRGDHWDYGALNTPPLGGDKEAALLDIVQHMVSGGHFDYDLVTYTVASPTAYFGRPCFGCGSPYYYDGWPSSFHLGLAFGSGSCFDPFFFDPFVCRSRFFNPFFSDPFFFRPVVFTTIIVTPFAFRSFVFRRGLAIIFFGGRVHGGFGRPFRFRDRSSVTVMGPRLRLPPGTLLSRSVSMPVRGHAPLHERPPRAWDRRAHSTAPAVLQSPGRREPRAARAPERRAAVAAPTAEPHRPAPERLAERHQPVAVRRPELHDPVMVRLPERHAVAPSGRGPDLRREPVFTGRGGWRTPLARDRGWSFLSPGFGASRFAPTFRGGGRRR